MSKGTQYDVIVIGGGHAGTEAAHAAARMGCRTALVTLNASRIGWMSCNPAMGGLAKGQLVKEIDALGGIMGRMTDQAAIQYKRLNQSKGPAVRSSRAQCDKEIYAAKMQSFLAQLPMLSVLECEVSALLHTNARVSGVLLKDGTRLASNNVIITSGTFLRAIMHVGEHQTEGGRLGDSAAVSLSQSLEELGFRLRRLKTGTPPRLKRAGIDFSKTTPHGGDEVPVPFSFYWAPQPFPLLSQVNCFMTYTSEQTHEIINKNINRSPMYSGAITGVGPRYCPSIEDKVTRFQDKTRHQVFLEPEGLSSDEIYVNGVSTSLPQEVQEEFIRSIAGLENAQFSKFGYAVEYDAVDARQLKTTYESKDVEGLFTAGQINGTSGYEEAGAQGLIAGINAALRVKGEAPYTVGRHEGYIGVMTDDLTLKGSDEPYRMFTSRAEYRLLLREDNADQRLSPAGLRLGLLGERERAIFGSKMEQIEKLRVWASATPVLPTPETNLWLESKATSGIKDRVWAEVLLRRPEIYARDLKQFGLELSDFSPEALEQLEIQTKYAGYIERDLELLEGVRKAENLKIPSDLDLDNIAGLSNEIKGKLKLTRPETIGQASRIQGVTPAAVANLVLHLRMKRRGGTSSLSV